MIPRKTIFMSLFNVIGKLGEKEVARDFNGHVRRSTENNWDQNESCGTVVRKKGESIFEFCAAMEMTVGNA